MLVVASRKDVAGMNIAKYLFGVDVKYVDEDILFANVKTEPDKRVIFASRHKAESGRSSLTVHPTGNYASAEFGGKPKTLSHCNAQIMAQALGKLFELNKDPNFEVTLECTHHGPYTEQESFFIEVGSKLKDWENEKACETVAKVIISILKNKPKKRKVVIGFGGQHYPKKFTKLCLDEGLAFGHICPKYNIENLSPDLIKQMIERTHPRPERALIDKKSLKSRQKRLVKSLCENVIETEEI